VPAHLQQAAQASLDRAWECARQFYRYDPKLGIKPALDYALRSQRVLGMCYFNRRRVAINPVYLSSDTPAIMREILDITIPHEVAHQVAFDLFGDRGHGLKWKEVMNDVMELSPDRLSRINTTKFATDKERIIIDAFNRMTHEDDTE